MLKKIIKYHITLNTNYVNNNIYNNYKILFLLKIIIPLRRYRKTIIRSKNNLTKYQKVPLVENSSSLLLLPEKMHIVKKKYNTVKPI